MTMQNMREGVLVVRVIGFIGISPLLTYCGILTLNREEDSEKLGDTPDTSMRS